METIYQKIADQIQKMIPEKWSSAYLYAEKWADYDTVYFYYYPENDIKALLHYEITERFQVDSTEFEHLEDKLRDAIAQATRVPLSLSRARVLHALVLQGDGAHPQVQAGRRSLCRR